MTYITSINFALLWGDLQKLTRFATNKHWFTDLQYEQWSTEQTHKIAANEQRRWWSAKQAAAAGTVSATGGHGSGLSVGGVVVTRMTTVTGRLEPCVDGLRPGGLAGGPWRCRSTRCLVATVNHTDDGTCRSARQEDWLYVVMILLSTKEQHTREWDFSRESPTVLTVHLKTFCIQQRLDEECSIGARCHTGKKTWRHSLQVTPG